MARYSKIDRRIWNDEKFRRLSRLQPCGQALFLYLLTNRFVGNVPGVYSAGEAMLAEALGWSVKAFREVFREVLQEGLVKADLEARLIWIPNVIRYNQPENPNVVKSWQDTWDELPECSLKLQAWEAFEAALSARGKEWLDTFKQIAPKPSSKGSAKGMPKGSRKGMANQEQEQEQKQEQCSSLAHLLDERNEDSSAIPSDGHPLESDLAALAEEIYAQYPRRVGKQDALRAIAKAIQIIAKRNHGGDLRATAEWLKGIVVRYANSPQGMREDKQFTPYPATWFNDGRYDDDESEWNLASKSKRPDQQFINGQEDSGFGDVLSRPAPEWATATTQENSR